MWITWHTKAWDDYVEWTLKDRNVAKRINLLVKALSNADPTQKPIGQAERLKHSKHGLCSARIDHSNRLVYKIDGDYLRIASCKGHYEIDEKDFDF